MLDIDFGSARNDDLQPQNLCSCIDQIFQEMWATLSIVTLIKCINDKDESMLRVVRKGVDELKEERAFHRLWINAWVVTKVFCYNGSKRGEEYGEFVDKSGKDVYGLAEIQVIPLAEKAPARWFH